MNTISLYKKAIDCFNHGDLEGMAMTWDDDIVIMDMTDDKVVARGKRNALKMFKKQYKHQPTHITVDNVVVMGNKVVSFEKEEDQEHHVTEAICILEEDHGLFKKVYWLF